MNAVIVACAHLTPNRSLAALNTTRDDYLTGARWLQEETEGFDAICDPRPRDGAVASERGGGSISRRVAAAPAPDGQPRTRRLCLGQRPVDAAEERAPGTTTDGDALRGDGPVFFAGRVAHRLHRDCRGKHGRVRDVDGRRGAGSGDVSPGAG